VIQIPTTEALTIENNTQGAWTFLTSHARVLSLIAQDPDIRTRDLAATAEITERSAQRIVSDLEAGGYLTRTREGRRNHYSVTLDATLRHPHERDVDVSALLLMFSETQE
jgi:DNA-binding MarR family transcriptional regulator